MTQEKRQRGRPKVLDPRPRMIQKHVFMDEETAEMLKELAQGNESGYIRELIKREFRKKR